MKQNPIDELQKIRLDKKEFDFCRGLFDKITKMPAFSEKDRENVLSFLKSECERKKFNAEFNRIETEEAYIVYEFKLNNKPCFVAFDAEGKNPANLIPSGVVNLQKPISTN